MMRKEYDFEKMEGRKNPYAKQQKKQVTIRIGVDIIDYFKDLPEETGVPYQNLINLYLRDCVQTKRKPSFSWMSNSAHSTSMSGSLWTAARRSTPLHPWTRCRPLPKNLMHSPKT